MLSKILKERVIGGGEKGGGNTNCRKVRIYPRSSQRHATLIPKGSKKTIPSPRNFESKPKFLIN